MYMKRLSLIFSIEYMNYNKLPLYFTHYITHKSTNQLRFGYLPSKSVMVYRCRLSVSFHMADTEYINKI